MTDALLSVRGLTVEFDLPRSLLGRRRRFRAVDDVSFEIAERETLGLVGESGSGKSTISRAILGLQRPTSGEIVFDGTDLVEGPAPDRRRVRPEIQVVFQNPYASLNPVHTIGDAVGEALEVHRGLRGGRLRDTVADLLAQVGLDPAIADRRPHVLSGGQRQRVAVARAIALQPRFLIADEAVSALDVSTRGQILNLLVELGDRLGLAGLFIGHDLAVVRHVSDRIAVLYRGRILEAGPADAVADHPQHPYTRNLVASVPVPDPALQARRRATRRIVGSAAGAATLEAGCVFVDRCPDRLPVCETVAPTPRQAGASVVRCHLHPATDAERVEIGGRAIE